MIQKYNNENKIGMLVILLVSQDFIIFENSLLFFKLEDLNGVTVQNLKKHLIVKREYRKADEENFKELQVKVDTYY